jgi:electron transfer flavoprotein alpha subunit
MSKIKINHEKLTEESIKKLLNICPFNAFEYEDGKLSINSACKVCKLCVKKGPDGVCEYVESIKKSINKNEWVGIGVYVEHDEEGIHPVTLELIGKAKELAKKVNHPVHAIIIGHNVNKKAETLLRFGVDKVFKYDHELLSHFNIERFTNVLSHYIEVNKPCSILIGATSLGRAFAPRVAARFKTGLTADCTVLDIKENTDLVQIRPAFGGNIMASIITSNNRPQLSTVRYKVFNKPAETEITGIIVEDDCANISLESKSKLIEIKHKEKGMDIAEAEIIVACGRSFKTKQDLQLASELADLLGAELACTRPLVENGWFDPRRQIGLSGRTVAPKLLINLGISGSVQFVAGIKNSEFIVSVNNDKNASIMDNSHLAIVGDIYEIIPKLIRKIKEDGVLYEL